MKVEEAAAVLSSPLSRQFSAPTTDHALIFQPVHLRLSDSHSTVFFSKKNQSDQPDFSQATAGLFAAGA
jgi:hypothetical protein